MTPSHRPLPVRAVLALLRRRGVRTALSLGLTLLLGVMLVFTIRYTLLDLQWLAFLGGVLFAAVLATASTASKAEWVIARRTRQFERARDLLAREQQRSHTAGEAQRTAEARQHFVLDLLPVPVLFIDRDLRVRGHNRAASPLTGRPDAQITGQPLRDIAGAQYPALLAHAEATLQGAPAEYPLAWTRADGTAATYTVRQAPYPPGDPHPPGYYLLLLPEAATVHDGGPVRTRSDPLAAITSNSGDTLYLHSLSDQLMGWDEPRAKLINALQRDEFILFAQKILPLKQRPFEHGCYEILLRLQEEENNLLPPGGFIPVAERYGMTEDIDRWVVRHVIQWALARRQADPAWDMPLFCINLSEAAIGNPAFARFVRAELQRTEFPAHQLCFEIGEMETIGHHDDVAHFIAALKPAGCRFTVDAFGSIKLSFAHLSGLAVDFIKIDGVITQNLFKTPGDLVRLRNIVGVSQKLGVRTIAEFVEDGKTLQALREAGIDYAQGFGIDHPGPITRIA